MLVVGKEIKNCVCGGGGNNRIMLVVEEGETINFLFQNVHEIVERFFFFCTSRPILGAKVFRSSKKCMVPPSWYPVRGTNMAAKNSKS